MVDVASSADGIHEIISEFGKPEEAFSAGQKIEPTGWTPVPNRTISAVAYSFRNKKSVIQGINLSLGGGFDNSSISEPNLVHLQSLSRETTPIRSDNELGALFLPTVSLNILLKREQTSSSILERRPLWHRIS